MVRLLDEWYNGLEQGPSGQRMPSVVQLEDMHGTQWRRDGRTKQRYFVRKKLVGWVSDRAARDGKEIWEVARSLGKSPYKLHRMIFEAHEDPLPVVES